MFFTYPAYPTYIVHTDTGVETMPPLFTTYQFLRSYLFTTHRFPLSHQFAIYRHYRSTLPSAILLEQICHWRYLSFHVPVLASRLPHTVFLLPYQLFFCHLLKSPVRSNTAPRSPLSSSSGIIVQQWTRNRLRLKRLSCKNGRRRFYCLLCLLNFSFRVRFMLFSTWDYSLSNLQTILWRNSFFMSLWHNRTFFCRFLIIISMEAISLPGIASDCARLFSIWFIYS